jgi:hypothetical protein
MLSGMQTCRITLSIPGQWFKNAEEEAMQRRIHVADLIREKLGCGEVQRGRPALSPDVRQHSLEIRQHRKTRVNIGLVLQERELLLKGVKLVPGQGIEPSIYCAKRDLEKLRLWDGRTQMLKLQGTPYEDLQPVSPAAPQAIMKGSKKKASRA